MKTQKASFIRIAALTILAACAAPGGGVPAETAADTAAIRALGDAFEVAWSAGDAAALGQLVTEDYSSVEPDGSVITGRAGFEAMEKTGAEERKGAGMALDITSGPISFINGMAASSAGTWTLKGVPAGGGPDKGSYLTVSVKGTDGKWRMRSALAASYVAPPPAPTTPAGKGGGF